MTVEIERSILGAIRTVESTQISALDVVIDATGNPAAGIRHARAAIAALPAGENAAFAAAQLSARTFGEDAAREHFVRYLARYPAGRFANEARARLARDAN